MNRDGKNKWAEMGKITADLDLDLTKTQIVSNTGVTDCDMKNCDAGQGGADQGCVGEGPKKDDVKDTKKLVYMILAVVLFFGLVAGIIWYSSQSGDPVTIDGLHSLNFKGELEPDQGYMYNGYSFIKYADVWYTQLENEDTLFDVTFNYDPESVDDIPIEGMLTSDFVKDGKLYVTFDPEGEGLKWVGVANFGISRSLAWAFGYELKAGCIKNVTKACQEAGVIECGDPEKAVIYLKEADEPKVILAENCVIVQGRGEDLVKAKDRLLLRWYGITGEVNSNI